MARISRSEAKAQTRNRLLDAAEGLFLENGYAATAMEQIAQAAGVTKAAIYRHFSGKEDLFLALRERRTQLIDASPVATDSTAAYEKRLAKVARRVAQFTDKADPRLMSLHLEFRAISLRRPEARQRFAEEIRTLVAAAEADRPDDDVRLKKGVTEAEVLILGQLLMEGLMEYRAFVPDLVTESTFATALRLLASLTAAD